MSYDQVVMKILQEEGVDQQSANLGAQQPYTIPHNVYYVK